MSNIIDFPGDAELRNARQARPGDAFVLCARAYSVLTQGGGVKEVRLRTAPQSTGHVILSAPPGTVIGKARVELTETVAFAFVRDVPANRRATVGPSDVIRVIDLGSDPCVARAVELMAGVFPEWDRQWAVIEQEWNAAWRFVQGNYAEIDRVAQTLVTESILTGEAFVASVMWSGSEVTR